MRTQGKAGGKVKRIIVVTKGDREHGLGHVSRQLVLARELARHDVRVWFQTPRTTPGGAWIARAGYPILEPDEVGPAAHAAVIDLEHGPTRLQLERAREQYPLVIVVAGNGYTLQDYDAVRELADLEIYQGLDVMLGDKAVGGIQYVLIDPAFRECTPNIDGPVVLNFGGSDPHSLTEPSLAALAGLEREVICITGPARLPLRGDYPRVTVVDVPPSLVPYLNGASLFLGAFGTVAWEALAAGVPCILTGWSPQHMDTVLKLQGMGVAQSLGLWSEFDAMKLRSAVDTVLQERSLWPAHSTRARGVCDGQGAGRVAAKIVEVLG